MNNSLKIREKFINKIVNKMEELEDRLDLLNKVDNKLIKKGYKINRYTRSERSQQSQQSQRGGAEPIVEPVIDLAQMQREVAIKQRQLNDLTKTTEGAVSQVAAITEAIGKIQENIKNYKIPQDQQAKLLQDIETLKSNIEGIKLESIDMAILEIKENIERKIQEISTIASGVNISGINEKLASITGEIQKIKPSGTVQSAKIKELSQVAFNGIVNKKKWDEIEATGEGSKVEQLGITEEDYEKAIQ
jgi:hypothetical protein